MNSTEMEGGMQSIEDACLVDEPATRTVDIGIAFGPDAQTTCLDQLHEALKFSEDTRKKCKNLHFRSLSEFSKLHPPCDFQVYISRAFKFQHEIS